MAAMRVFTCGCGHRLRFGAALCGKCYEPTSLLNRTGFWLAVLAIVVLALLLVLR